MQERPADLRSVLASTQVLGRSPMSTMSPAAQNLGALSAVDYTADSVGCGQVSLNVRAPIEC